MNDSEINTTLAEAMGWHMETDAQGNRDWIKPNGFRYGIFYPLEEGNDVWEVIDWMEQNGKKLRIVRRDITEPDQYVGVYKEVYFGPGLGVHFPDEEILTPRMICLAAIEALK